MTIRINGNHAASLLSEHDSCNIADYRSDIALRLSTDGLLSSLNVIDNTVPLQIEACGVQSGSIGVYAAARCGVPSCLQKERSYFAYSFS